MCGLRNRNPPTLEKEWQEVKRKNNQKMHLLQQHIGVHEDAKLVCMKMS